MHRHLRWSIVGSAVLIVIGLTVNSPRAAEFQWSGTNNAVWSDASSWTVTGTDADGLPDADDSVLFTADWGSATEGRSWVDAAFTVSNFTVDIYPSPLAPTVDREIDDVSGGSLTVLDSIDFYNYRVDLRVPITITNAITWTTLGGTHPRGYVYSPISGSGSIYYYGQADQLTFVGDNPFSGGFEAVKGQVNEYGANQTPLGRGPISLGGKTNGADNAAISFILGKSNDYGPYGVVLTVESGSGSRTIQMQSGSDYSFSMDIVLEKDLTVNSWLVPDTRSIVFDSNISGAGGLLLTDTSGTAPRMVLNGSNTYAGATVVDRVFKTLEFNGQTRGNIALVTNVTMSGSALIDFLDGDRITVTNGATANVSNMTFDVTGLTWSGTPIAVLDYNGGNLAAPANLDSLLSAGSATWTLSDTNSTVLAAKTVTDDAYEDNDTAATAYDPGFQWTNTPLTSIAGGGLQADEDWYVIHFTRRGRERLILDLTFTHADGNIDVDILRASDTNLECSAASTTDNEHIDFELSTAPATYFVRVYGDNNTNPYDLVWTENASTSSVITWTGGGATNTWSDTGNWDRARVPQVNDLVVFNTDGFASALDADYEIRGMRIEDGTQNGRLSGSAHTLTVGLDGIDHSGGASYDNGIDCQVHIDEEQTWIAGGQNPHFYLNQNLSGGGDLTIDADYIFRFDGNDNGAYTGRMTIADGTLNANARLVFGLHPELRLGLEGSADEAAVTFFSPAFADDGTNLIVVASGSGQRNIRTIYGNSHYTLYHPIELHNDLVFSFASGSQITQRGAVSGTGGIVKYNAETLTLAATNTYTGTTTVMDGTLTIDGAVARGNIMLNSAGSLLNGTGTVSFRDGDTIVATNGPTVNAASLTFDLTGMTDTNLPAVIVNYAGGAFTGPARLDDLLSAGSVIEHWFLKDTGSEILADLPPRGMLIVVR